MNRHHRRALAVAACALACTAVPALPFGQPLGSSGPAQATLASDGQCTFPAASIPGEPWALQRVLLSQLGNLKGQGVTVAVIDSGVDDNNPQLAGAVVAGQDFLKSSQSGTSTTDPIGHGTMVAGIIAARPGSGTGFQGLAPSATILSIRQNDGQPGTATEQTLSQAIDYAAGHGAQVINISQDLTDSNGQPYQGITASSQLAQSVQNAIAKGIVVVAAAGNENQSLPTYPAALPGVLGVGASDRNNERADGFSEMGKSVAVAAPGVDIVSTVPKGGQCVDNGTSFAAPYAAAVAALLREKYPHWTPAQIVARIEQTAQRTDSGPNADIGWGVVDPVAAVTDNSPPEDAAVPTAPNTTGASPVQARPFALGETQQQKDQRTALFALTLGAIGLVAIAGTATVLRDNKKRGARPITR